MSEQIVSDIAAVGLGSMGSALARAFQGAGHRVTVWNRTASKMHPFVAGGANGASTAAEAIRSSPVVLVCVDDYAVTRQILELGGAAADLSGRTLIQLSTGTPREAREAAAWLSARGGDYIDGAILGGPSSIATERALLLFGGPQPAFARCEHLLKCLGGQIRYLGENVGAPAALDLAWLCQRFGLFVGVAHGARICESENVGLDLYASMFPEADRARLFAEVIHAEAFEHPSASLSIWHGALRRVQTQARDCGISCEVPDFILTLFERAIAEGHGEEDVAALVKVLRHGTTAR